MPEVAEAGRHHGEAQPVGGGDDVCVLHAAARLRDGRDAVFCPVEDGGYALIGLTRAAPALFDAMTWGADIVMEQTRQRLRNLGWRWHELPTHWDLDRPEDYQRLVHEGWIADAEPGGKS